MSPAVQIIPAQVSTPTAIKVLKQSRGPRAPRISGGEERSSPGNRTGSTEHTQGLYVVFMYAVYMFQQPESTEKHSELPAVTVNLLVDLLLGYRVVLSANIT